MKKNTIVYLVLVACLVSGILFAKIFEYYFFGYFCAGASAALMVLNYFGQRQLNNATERIDKLMKDEQLSNDFDNDNTEEDD